MTQRNQECKVQVQALRVSARIAALAALALALALTPYPATPSDREEPRPTRATDDLQRGGQQVASKKGTLGGSNRLLSSRDVAAILAIPERTVRDRWKEWGLPAYRIGKHLRWKERDVYAWIERQSALVCRPCMPPLLWSFIFMRDGRTLRLMDVPSDCKNSKLNIAASVHPFRGHTESTNDSF